ncbi:MAG: hypothetical protein CL556_11485 [Alphaproteobacteria bacterium]|nr:hypothetical protein [Alphaproteobacteria bacterium]MAJ64598.1 hypothetical protein [Alphaproteobacteria bacterium]|tara:strand:+ start:8709 stop:9005 length:297 start_codon:yes stop_codon:yes gene_type:complete
MASLSNKIRQYVNAEVDFNSDVLLQNDSDGKGDYIKEWNLDNIAKPTDAQLDALETEANAYEQELKDAEQTAINKKASAKQKLKDLGLDDEELKSMGL